MNPSQIIFGMISSDFINNFENALQEIKKVKQNYPNFGGVYVREYCNSPPDGKNPYLWSERVGQILSESQKLNVEYFPFEYHNLEVFLHLQVVYLQK